MNKRLFVVIIIAVVVSLLLASCGKENGPAVTTESNGNEGGEKPAEILISDSESIKFTVIYPDESAHELSELAKDLKGNLSSACGGFADLKKDSAPETEYEILLGKTNREASASVYLGITKNQYSVSVSGTKIVLAGGCYSSLKDAVNKFISVLSKNESGEVKMSVDFSASGEISDIEAKLNLEDNWNAKSYKASNGVNMPYQIYMPANYDDERAYPCILYMHSAGVRCTDNSHIKQGEAAFLFNLVKSKYKDDVIVIAPCCPETEKWVPVDNWNSITYDFINKKPAPYMVATMELFNYYRTELNIDDTRLYTYGMSMGGFAVWDLLTRNAGLFAAAVPVAGAGDPAAVGDAAGTAIWIFHGSVDSAVPVESARIMKKALEDAGRTDILYTEFKGSDHGIWGLTADTKGLFEWLFDQQLIK